MKQWILKAAIIAAGMLGGYLYYFIGCDNKTCAIQSNPVISTLYGGLIGLLLAISISWFKKPEEKTEDADV